MLAEMVLLYIIVFVYGIVIGSFVNVLICRLPEHENIATERSHCMSCGHKLRWYDLVPLFSWLFLRGKCRYCGARISAQYPIVEAINGLGYVLILFVNGISLSSILYMLCFSILTAIAVIDWRTYEIPVGLNIAILALGVAGTIADYRNVWYHLIGMVSVSGFLLLLYIVTRGRGIGGGDIKLMGAAGLLLGWKHIIFALVIGCVIGSVVHIILMKVKGKNRVLAFGPYLATGLFAVMLWGSQMINWYAGLFM